MSGQDKFSDDTYFVPQMSCLDHLSFDVIRGMVSLVIRYTLDIQRFLGSMSSNANKFAI